MLFLCQNVHYVVVSFPGTKLHWNETSRYRNRHCANCIGTLSFPVAKWHLIAMCEQIDCKQLE